MHRSAKAELHFPAGEVLDDGSGVGEGAGEAVELGYDQRVAGPGGGERLPKARAFPVGASQPWST